MLVYTAVILMMLPIWLGYLAIVVFFPLIALLFPILGLIWMFSKIRDLGAGRALVDLGHLDPRVLKIPIREMKEPLIDFSLTYPDLLEPFESRNAHRRIFGHPTIALMLRRAQKLLPLGFQLRVTRCFDAKSPLYQSGAAVNVVLLLETGQGRLRLSEAPSVLEMAMSQVGFVRDPQALQCWSYGDQYWAFATQLSENAMFGPTAIKMI